MGFLKSLFGSGKNRDDAATPHPLQAAAEMERMRRAGFIDGREHYTAYIEQVKQLKRDGDYETAIPMLIAIVDASEREADATPYQCGVTGFGYENLAIIYRKEKRYNDEVAILERYVAQQNARGCPTEKLGERLLKAREIAEKADSAPANRRSPSSS